MPDSSSCSTTPSEKTSERASAVLPSSSSGATYDILPLTMPASVTLARSASTARAMPKSTTFTVPFQVTMMLGGVTSRWTMPSGLPSGPVSVCAKSSPRQAWRPISATNAGGGTSRRLSSRRRSSQPMSKPSTGSMTM